MSKFKKGDKVYIADGSKYYDQGLKSGEKMLGTVTDDMRSDGWYYVQWETGDVNSYEDKDLIHAKLPAKNPTTTCQNGFEVGETVECCENGMGMGPDQIGKLFTIVEFGDYGGDPGVKLKYKSNGKIFSNYMYNDFVDIRSIRKPKQSTSEPEQEVYFTIDGVTYKYQLESTFYNYNRGDNSKIFELLGVNKYKFCSEVYGYEAAGGDWPTWKSGDKEAPIKIVKAIREEIQKREKPSTKPDYDAILAEAKRRYPVGVKYRPLSSHGDEWACDYVAKFECKWYRRKSDGDPYDSIDCGEGLVYWNGKWAEVKEETPSVDLDDAAILAEAKRRYPIGTVYNPLNSNGGLDTPGSVGRAINECSIVFKDKHGIGIDCGYGYVYAYGKWAEVIGTTGTVTTQSGVVSTSEGTGGYTSMFVETPPQYIKADGAVYSDNHLPQQQIPIIIPKTKTKNKIKVL